MIIVTSLSRYGRERERERERERQRERERERERKRERERDDCTHQQHSRPTHLGD